MELKTKIYESIGQASMCWDPIPSGIFDSTQAQKIGDELWNEIQKQRETIEKLRECLNWYSFTGEDLTEQTANDIWDTPYMLAHQLHLYGEKARRVLEDTK